jgi:hypothetical protein
MPLLRQNSVIPRDFLHQPDLYFTFLCSRYNKGHWLDGMVILYFTVFKKSIFSIQYTISGVGIYE